MFKSLKLKKWTSWVLSVFMILAYALPNKISAAEAPATVDLQILATSDLHGRFMPYVYATDSENLNGSLAQIATVIKQQKALNPNTIIVDNGDTIQDNSNQLFLKDEYAIHPMVLAMNEIGYDTWTLGNHEFNFGMTNLNKVMKQFKGTVLAGNVYDSQGKAIAASYQIVEKGGVKVGIVGMTNPNITKWDAANLAGYTVTSPIVEARKIVDQIKGQVDVLVAVIHVGPTEEYGNDDGADKIATAIPEFAAIIAGHAHSKVPGNRTANNSVIVEPTNAGGQVAKVNLILTQGPDGKYTVVDNATNITSSLITINKDITPDADLVAKLAPYHNAAITDARTVIGKLDGGDLVAANAVKGIPTSQIQDTPMIDLINEVQMYYTGAKVSAAAAFDPSANIRAGNITKAGVSNIYKYDNTLYKLQVTGAQLKKYMEWSANFYNTYSSGDLTLSFDPSIRGYNYDMFDGVTYDVDVSKDKGSRITNLKWLDGSSVKDDEVFVLAVNNYRANSQLLTKGVIYSEGDMPKLLEKDVKGDIGGVRELITDYIINVRKGVLTPKLNNNWKAIGNNWDAGQRDLAVRLINNDILSVPTSADSRTPNVKSITWADVTKLGYKNVDILSFNDFHGSLKEDGKNIGAAKLAGAINNVRTSNPDTIVVTGGDLYQGSAMSNLKYGEPVSDVLKTIGITASAIGNHEFDWGLDWISEWAKDGGFDFLASNIYSKTTGQPVSWAEPWKVVEKGGIKIGLIGLATPETAIKTKPDNVKNIEFRDPVASANEWAKYLKETQKVDVVVALTHLGAMQDSKTKAITGEAADFANAVKGVDAVISAHTHQIVSGTVNNIPIVQGYYNGRSIARLTFEIDPTGKVMAIAPSVDNLYTRVSSLTADTTVKAIVDKYDAELKPILDEVVGTTDKDLTHDKNAAGVSILGQWTSDVMKAKAGTQIAIQNGGGLRTSIPKGDITMGKMYEVMPFDNTLYKMELKGSDIKKNIENGIANASIGWVQFSGMKVYYDVNRAVGDRILGMYLMDGTKMDMDKYYTVVTNDFMATGGDGYNFAAGKNQVDTGTPIREALVEALRNLKAEGKVLSVTPIDYLIASAPPADIAPIANDTAKVVEAIKTAPAKSTVYVDITTNPKASKEIFEAIKGQDKNVTFTKDGVTWTFNGLNISESLIKDIDLSLKTVSDELKAKEIAKIKAVVGKDISIVPFSFNYDGPLPGEAIVKVFIGKEWANREVYINRYYADKNTYEIIQTATVDANGYVEFKTNHCSDYFVMDKTAAPNLPKTGSNVDTSVMVSTGLLVIMLGAAFVVAGRKKEELEA